MRFESRDKMMTELFQSIVCYWPISKQKDLLSAQNSNTNTVQVGSNYLSDTQSTNKQNKKTEKKNVVVDLLRRQKPRCLIFMESTTGVTKDMIPG
jgi:hypothetical protein